MSKKDSYDLTTAEGAKNALALLEKHSKYLALGGPIGLLAKLALDRVFESSTDVVTAQAKAAADIIRAGAENNAAEIDITLSQEAGAHFKADFEGNPLKFTLGKSGTVKMTVKYKDAA